MPGIDESIAQFISDADLAHQIVHGDANTTVTTEGGVVDSLARAVARISLSGTSSSNLTIETGSKIFSTQANKGWVLGQRLRAASDDGTKIMEGEVTAYSGTDLTLAVDRFEGAGTHADWNIGLAGAVGATGADGTDGSDGADGADGATWFSGATDPAGGTGVDGDHYLQTAVGDTGGIGSVWLKAAGSWSIVGSIRGAAGADGTDGSDGADGALWFSGSADPDNGTGSDGDYYLQLVAGSSGGIGSVWKKITGTWSLEGNIRGPAGSGTGDVNGPGSASNNELVLFADGTGKLVKASGVLLAAIALLASPAFTGTPTAPTAAPGTNTTQIATTAFVKAAIDALVAAAPGVLDTLDELAAALGDDANFASTMTTALAGKVATSRTISAAGLATGGGDLSADRTITVPKAGASAMRAGTNDTDGLTAKAVYDAAAEVTLVDAATIAWDMSAGVDFVTTPTGARTMGNPTNVVVGKKGRLRVLGSGTLTWSGNYEFAGGVAPTLTTGDDALYYDCISSTRILIFLGAGNHS